MNDSTKEKILKAAHQLFAQKGMYGVSVRDIAKACDVNVAAINYHFSNKENLYAQTILSAIETVETEINQIYVELEDTHPLNFSLKIMDYFMQNSEDLRSVFIMISSSDDAPVEMLEHMQKYKGPPGLKTLGESILKHYPKATEEDILWFSRSIIGIIMHKAMIMCNRSVCTSMQEVGITFDTFREDLERLVKALLRDLPE